MYGIKYYKLNSILCINSSFIKLSSANGAICDGCFFHHTHGCVSPDIGCINEDITASYIFKKL